MTNKENILPNEYFANLKSLKKSIDTKQIDEDLKVLISLIEDAKEVGQTELVENYENLVITFAKERQLFKNGYTQFVYKDDIEKYILNVKDKVVKICELKRFPRSLPAKVREKIKAVKELDLFDDLWVLFIDYNTKEVISEKEKKIRAKNRDPILFGTMMECLDRFYFIIDWEDEICDLNFNDMLKELKKMDAKYKPQQLQENVEDYVQHLIIEKNRIMTENKKTEEEKTKTKENITFYEKVKKTCKVIAKIWKE